MPVLKDKIALVTGGTSGLGREAALGLAQAGAKVVVCGRRAAEGAETVAMIRAAGGEAQFVAADVTVASEVEALVAETVRLYGRLDIAFNNSGIAGRGRLADIEEADFDSVMAVNVKGVWLSMRYEIRQFLAQGGGGAIINTSSIQGHRSLGGSGHYTASKHAVEGLTKTGAVDYASQGIRINAIAPAMLSTPMTKGFMARTEVRDAHFQRYPIGRVAELSELVGAIVFLASDAATYVNGVSLPVDGGYLVT